MEPFFPFIHQIPKKELNEPLPLYIELDAPLIDDEEKRDSEEESRVIIIDLW